MLHAAMLGKRLSVFVEAVQREQKEREERGVALDEELKQIACFLNRKLHG